MRRILFISLILASGFPPAPAVQVQESPDSQQARKLAEQVLTGREVIVRLYHDPKNNPKAFDRLAVKLDSLYVKTDAVRLAFAASKTADTVDVSFEQLLASGQAANTSLDRLVQSTQAMGPVFEQMEESVEIIEQATGRKFVELSDLIDGYGRGRGRAIIPSTWVLPASIAESAGTAGSAVAQMLASSRGDVPLDRMLQAGKAFQTTAPTIDLWAKNLRLRLASVVRFAEAVKTNLDPSAENAGQVQAAIDRIIRLGQESAPTLEQIAKDGESVRMAGQPIESSVRAVERALDKMLEQKALVVTGEDQTDEAVAAVVGEFIYAHEYRFGPAFSIWPSKLTPPRYPWCLFQDADKQPIADAPVEVFIGQGYQWNEGVWLWTRNAKLDEQGRLKAPRPGSGGFDKFVFMVHYPDFGELPVGPHAMELPNQPHLIYSVPVLPKDKWCVFKDALGNPMPNATVEVFQDVGWRKESRCMETATLDEMGRLKPPRLDPRLEYSCFIVSHPDYGTALVEPRRFVRTEGPLAGCTVPLGRMGTDADQRSIWGRVEDANGTGVSQAIIRCRSLDIPGGGHISLLSPRESLRSITDANGLFALLATWGANGSSRPAPHGAKYAIEITAPKELGLQAYEGSLQAGQETIITLQPADPNYLPALIFYDELGPVTEPEMLGPIRITVKKPDGSIWSPPTYDHWQNLIRRFVPGRYYAEVDWNGKHYVFEPVDLTEQRPDTVVFKPQKIISPTDILFRGQIVHGITGQPIAGAIVLTPPSRDMAQQRDPEAEELQDVVPLYPEVCTDEAKLALLTEIFDAAASKFAETDENGLYQIALAAPSISTTAELVAINRDFLGARQQLSFLAINSQAEAHLASRLEFAPDQTGCVQVPPMKLFPAATIIVEPNVPVATDPLKPKVRLRLDWFNFPGDRPEWFDTMGDYTYPKKNQGAYLFYKIHLRPNRANTVYVAAGLEMNIEIRLLERPESAPIIIPGVKLEQGQIADLGKWEFGPTIEVAVRVVDPRGKPVEGVNVRQTKAGMYWGQQKITNHQGLATFRAPLYSEGDFVVGCYGASLPSSLTERTRYQVGGEEDTGKEFTLQLSDEILHELFK